MTTWQIQRLVTKYNKVIFKTHKKALRQEMQGYSTTAANTRSAIRPMERKVEELEQQLTQILEEDYRNG